MDFENHKNDKCLNKILARNASVGCSSRIYYYRSSEEGVPFKWEMQPGIPKHTPEQELLPPISPPPAILSLSLPKPSISEQPKPWSSSWDKLWFWKKQNRTSKKVKEEGSQECLRDGVNDGLDVVAGLECSSDSESVTMASPFESSFSSSSSSSVSFMKSRPSLMSASSESPTTGIYGKPLSCFPMHISKILVSIARRD